MYNTGRVELVKLAVFDVDVWWLGDAGVCLGPLIVPLAVDESIWNHKILRIGAKLLLLL